MPQNEKEIKVSIIPKPQETIVGNGYFTWKPTSTIFVEPSFKNVLHLLDNVFGNSGLAINLTENKKATVQFLKDITLPNEGYSLNITPKNIIIKSSTVLGARYAVQTLRQLLPNKIEIPNQLLDNEIHLPEIFIKDAPKFSYRGMHLDVSRHFFEVSFIKKYLDYLALLKLNTFHWHLTDDQGWRIEIKKHPNLTAHGAYRDSTLLGHYNDTPQQYNKKKYGGYYTQEQIKEVVAYAQNLGITIIPEIEMPGHAQAAISAYPQLGCTKQPIEVATKWGVFEDVFCPTPATFTFLEEVLEEVVALFPGEYIHIGGDEVPKIRWKECDYCKKLMEKEDLEDEAQLQSYFIKRISNFLAQKGKKIIGWDEILEGGLPPNATVMSWRGTQGGENAAKNGHPVIMSPTSHCYFDYYQSDHPEEPLAIGGYLPLKKVYGFNPIPTSLNTEEAKFIIGAQGNVWTEYIPTPQQVEYMLFPRILALSEVLWNGPTKNIENNYPEFVSRVTDFNTRLEVMGVNFANHLFDLQSEITKQDDKVYFSLKTEASEKEILYKINNKPEKQYIKPLLIENNAFITSQSYKNGKPVGRINIDTIFYHKAVTAKININKTPHPSYGTGGKQALINGKLGSNSRYGDKEWLGFWGDDLEITLNFNKPIQVNAIKFRFYHAPGQWIYTPKKVMITTQEGVNIQNNLFGTENLVVKTSINLSLLTNSIKITIPNFGTIPDGFQGAGHKAWTFIDEIIVE